MNVGVSNEVLKQIAEAEAKKAGRDASPQSLKDIEKQMVHTPALPMFTCMCLREDYEVGLLPSALPLRHTRRITWLMWTTQGQIARTAKQAASNGDDKQSEPHSLLLLWQSGH